MPPSFETTRRVEFVDTDMAGIMHFSNFFRFMESAETAFLRARGLSVTWEQDGRRYGFPRVSASCDYATPARFGDELTIAVSIEKIGRKSVTYRYDFTRGGVSIAVGKMTAVYCRKGGVGEIEALDIPAEVRSKLES